MPEKHQKTLLPDNEGCNRRHIMYINNVTNHNPVSE